MSKKKLLIGIALLFVIITGVFLVKGFYNKRNGQGDVKKYEEIITENRGQYVVKNMIYKGTSLGLLELEKVMKDIRSTCQKPCKINLYSDREAYELDIMAGESSFDGYTEAQKNFLSTHLLAFWGIDNGDVIEYYPAK